MRIIQGGKSTYRAAVVNLIEELLERKLLASGPVPMTDGLVLHGAEVGVFRGELSEVILNTFPETFLYLVDSWAVHGPETPYRKSGDRVAKLNADEMEQCYQEAMRRTSKHCLRRQVVRADSVDAVPLLNGAMLDYVFIDADHTYEGVQRDLAAWWPMVRGGGLFMGHDYGHRRYTGVQRAVDEFAALQEAVVKTSRGHVWSMWKPSKGPVILP